MSVSSTNPVESTAAKPRKAPQVEVTDVCCVVGKRRILQDVTFTVPAHSRCAIIGPNGAGKSTLLRAIAAVQPAHSGMVTLDDVDVASMKGADRAKLIAFVGQEEFPPEDLTVSEMVALGRVPHQAPWNTGGKNEHGLVLESLRTVSLEDKAQRTTSQLSGGERRRALLARGLVQDTPLLMLDEPTNHLDVLWQLRLLRIIHEYSGTTIAAVHDLDLVWRHFDQVVVVADGGVIAAGKTQEALTAEVIRTAFGVESTVVSNDVTGEDHLLTFAASP